MADFIARIKPKKTSVAGEIPSPADLEVSELAVNTADGKLFVKHTDDTIKEISGSGGGGGGGIIEGSVRETTPQAITPVLPQGSAADVTLLNTGRAGQFISVEASCASWITFYSSRAARSADANRTQGQNPGQSNGVLMEVFTDQAETVLITPAVHYLNDDPNEASEIYAKVVNQDSSAQAVTINATVVPIEGRAVYGAEGSVRTVSPTVTTSSLADAASEDITLTQTARSGQFVTVSASHQARIVFYSNKAARTADASRAQGVEPLPGSGVLLEVVTTGAQTLEISPAVLYANTESGASGELYLSVTNLSGSDAEIEVTATVVPIEGRGVYLSELRELLDVEADAPADGQALVWDEATNKWIPGSVASGGGGDDVDLSTESVDALADVDTSTTAPTAGQALVWDEVNNKWIPGSVASGGGGDYEIQTADDFKLTQTSDKAVWGNRVGTLDGTADSWEWVDGNTFRFSTVIAGSVDLASWLLSWQVGDYLEFYLPNGFKKRYNRSITAIDSSQLYDPSVAGITVTFTGSAIPESEFSAIHVINQERPINPVDDPLGIGDLVRWDGNSFRNAQIGINELSDVLALLQYDDDDIAKPRRSLQIDNLSSVWFQSYHVPAGERWATYANQIYGPTFGRYALDPADGGTINDEGLRDGAARRTYYGTAGIMHNLGDAPLWLNGRLGTNTTNNTPELRWTSGNPQTGSAGHYIGLKLPENLLTDTTYTFPSQVDDGKFLRTDGAGNLSWGDPIEPNSPGYTFESVWLFNYEGTGEDYQVVDPALLSTADPKIGTSNLKINASQSDAQAVSGQWPASPFGDTSFIGTRAFTFQTWFKNLNPELPGNLGRYHRMVSARTTTSASNQPNGFQIRTWGGTTTVDGPQGALELASDELIIRGDTVITDQDWHHLAIQHDGAGNYWMFLDGVRDKFVARGAAYEFQNLDGWHIGKRNDDGADTFWMGELDATELMVGAAYYPNEGFTPPTVPAGLEGVVIVEQTQIRLAVISDVSDVDSVTTPPTDGQALVWDETAEAWVPGTVSGGGGGGGAVGSVNGETGAVSLGIQEMDDYELNLDPSGFLPSSDTGRWATFLTSHSQSGGNYTFPSSGQWRIYKVTDGSEAIFMAGSPDSDGESIAFIGPLDGTPGLMARIEVDGVTYGPVNVTSAAFTSENNIAVMRWDPSEFDPSTTSWGYVFDPNGPPVTTEARELNVVIGYADPTVVFPLADGDILQWNDADQKFKPAQLPTGVVAVDRIIGGSFGSGL